MKKLYPVSLALLLFIGALPLAALQTPAPRAPAKPAPSPTPPPVLEGTVKGPDGKPIADALVYARPMGYGAPAPAVSTRTDATGRFRLTIKASLPYTLRAEARGFAGRTVEKPRPGARIDIGLTRGVALEGIVRDGATGLPVPQARVEGMEGSSTALPWETEAGVVETTTDAKGRFRLEGLSSGPQTLRARAGGCGSGRQSAIAPGRPVDIYLFPGAILSGTVSGPGNAAVAGAIVRADLDMPRYRPVVRPVVTDAQGRYEIAGLEPGSYRVTARHKDFAPGVVPAVAVDRSGDVRVDVTLDKGAAVVGRLVNGPEPQGVAGRVSVQEVDGQRAPDSLRELLRAEAGADGRFRIEAFPAGSHALAVVAPGFASKRVEMQVGPAAREVNLGDVELERGLTIRGRVRERAGMPVAGATVVASLARPMPNRTNVRALAEADGSFVLAGLDPGPQRLFASAPGYAGTSRLAEPGAEKVEMILSPAGSVTGAVVDDGSRPVEAFDVNAQPVEEDRGEGLILRSPGFREVSAPDGRFVLEDLAEGTYVVEANAQDRASAHVSGVKVAPGSTTDVGTIRLPAGGVIRGNVVDTANMPVPGATVRVRSPGMEFNDGSGPRALSDPTGAFELRGVRLGTAEVSAFHPSYAEGHVSGIEVDPAKGVAEARIVLAQGGRIEGWVGRRDGTPIPGAYLRALSLQAGMPMFSPDAGPGLVTTNADGTFVMEHVPAGRATVNLMARSGSRFMGSQTKDVEVHDGESTPVEFRAREILVSGHVTRAGAPLPSARIIVRGSAAFAMYFGGGGDEVAAAPVGPQRMAAVTAEDGGYELIVDQPGSVRVLVDGADGRVRYPMKSADVPDADAFTLDLAYNVAAVAGIVVDKETDRPLPRARVFAGRKKDEPGASGASSAQAGDDGRFQLELEPGVYVVEASADDYGMAQTEVTVGSDGAGDLRFALTRGLVLSGKVVDTRGRGIGGLNVSAMDIATAPHGEGGFTQTLPDGTFRIGGLRPAVYRVVAQSEVGSFAKRDGVRPGDEDVVLTLRTGGRVSVRALGPDGQPVAAALVSSEDTWIAMKTDAQGVAELTVPAGTSVIRVEKDGLEGRATVTVSEGGVAATEVKLAPATSGSGSR